MPNVCMFSIDLVRYIFQAKVTETEHATPYTHIGPLWRVLEVVLCEK
jgi:hypothetical protein